MQSPETLRPITHSDIDQRNLPKSVEIKTYGQIRVRPLSKEDSLCDLTSLLHRAYERNTRNGIHYSVAIATEEQIRETSEKGKCFIAEKNGAIVGTVMYYSPEQARGTEWYNNPSVAVVGRLAVDPQYQGQQIGKILLNHVEDCARAHRATELALDTAKQAAILVGYYKSLGYREVGEVKWQGTGFTNIILSKPL